MTEYRTIAQRRKLVGKRISWARKAYPRAPKKDGEGVVVDAVGRNLQVDQHGSHDWLWVPDLAWIKVEE